MRGPPAGARPRHARRFGALEFAAGNAGREVPLFAIGVWLYVRSTRASDRTGRFALAGLVAFLVVMYLGNLFGPPPGAARDIAWLGHAQWLLVLWGYWVDAHREPAVTGVMPREAGIRTTP